MQNSLKLVSLNIEKDKHLSRFIPYISGLDADIVCLQEVQQNLAGSIAKDLGGALRFVPMTCYKTDGKDDVIIGIAIIVRHGIIVEYGEECCYLEKREEEGATLPISAPGSGHIADRYLQYVYLKKEDTVYPIGHTHFIWTPDGNPDTKQQEYFPKLLDLVLVKGLIFTGDLNMPRRHCDGTPGPFWTELSKNLTDNIPIDIKSTLDPVLHRAKGIELVIDSLFTPKKFRAEVQIISGMSDHKLIAANIFPVS